MIAPKPESKSEVICRTSNDLERYIMDCLLIARNFKGGEGRRNMVELIPVHKDLMAMIEAAITAARIQEVKGIQKVLRGGRLPVVASIFDSRITELSLKKGEV